MDTAVRRKEIRRRDRHADCRRVLLQLIAEGGTVLACPLNVSLFNISRQQLIDGVKVADPAKY